MKIIVPADPIDPGNGIYNAPGIEKLYIGVMGKTMYASESFELLNDSGDFRINLDRVRANPENIFAMIDVANFTCNLSKEKSDMDMLLSLTEMAVNIKEGK